MPLMEGKSKAAFGHNVEAERKAGKPMKQSLAIAYAVKKRAQKKAHGGFVEDSYQEEDHPEESHDMVNRIMHRYSKGGMVANDVGVAEADKYPAEYDDLVLRDDLDFSYDGANSGDELGDAREDHDNADMISRIMRSRAKKDRNPRPA